MTPFCPYYPDRKARSSRKYSADSLLSLDGEVSYGDHNVASAMHFPVASLPRLFLMADGSDTTLTAEVSGDVQSLATSIKTFAGEHGGARAVIEYVGRRGARIVLVGEDGEWSDQFAGGTDVARAACEAAGVTVENGWERELLEQMRPSNDLWRSMARRVLAR